MSNLGSAMDILKMLTRSTNLQKSSANSGKPISQHPSAGIPLNQSLFGAEGTPSVEPVKVHAATGHRQGVKRKRGSLERRLTRGEHDSLNFFEKHGEEIRNISPDLENSSIGGRISEPTQSLINLTEEECRKILRTHKVKITVLNHTTQSAGISETRKQGLSSQTSSHKQSMAHITPQPLLSFLDLRSKYGISKRLATNLEAQGYIKPTEVQLATLPLLLGSDEDRGISSMKKKDKIARAAIDLLTIAPTGSGKTLAFLVSTLHGLLQGQHSSNESNSSSPSRGNVSAIIIAPTHELADQIVNESKKLIVGTGLRVSVMRKGMKLISESGVGDNGIKNTRKSSSVVKADVLVTTPLILLHALSGTLDSAPRLLPSVRFLVLDEADVLLDPLFRAQTLAIWKCCSNKSLQCSLWSATIGSSIEALVQSIIQERRRQLELPSSNHYLIRAIVGLKDCALPPVRHRLIYAATEPGKLLAIRQLLHPSTTDASSTSSVPRPPFLVFTQTIPRAVALHSELLYDIPPEAGGSSRIAVLHSDFSDSARSNIMAEFRRGEIWILITTDLLSRGIDFRGINGVVNYDIPNTAAAYVHRAGRTGRAGRAGGVVVTLYTKEDIPYVKNIANVIAASEKNQGKRGENGSEALQKWLLDALPKVGKTTKKRLKNKGVEARRPSKNEKDGGREARKMRITTRSGFDRRLENKRKGAVKGSLRRRLSNENMNDSGSGTDEWGGIDV